MLGDAVVASQVRLVHADRHKRDLNVFDCARRESDTGSYAFSENRSFEPAPLHGGDRPFSRDTLPQRANSKCLAFTGLWRRPPRPVASALGLYSIRSLG